MTRPLAMGALVLLCLAAIAVVSLARASDDQYASLEVQALAMVRLLRSAAAEAAVRLEDAEARLAQRLAASARRADEALLHRRQPSGEVLSQVAREDQIPRIYLVNTEGRLVTHVRHPKPPTAAGGLLRPADTRALEEREVAEAVARLRPAIGATAVEGVRRNAFGTRQRFGVALTRGDGSTLLLRADTPAIEALRLRFGIGPLLDRLRSQPGVEHADVYEGEPGTPLGADEERVVAEAGALRVLASLRLPERPPTTVDIALSTATADRAVERTRTLVLSWAVAAGLIALAGAAWLHVRQVAAARTQAQLREQMEEERRLADMGALAALVTHEVRNPLNSIRFAVELLEDADDPKLLANARDTLRAESARMNETLEGFMALARPDRRGGRSTADVLTAVRRRTATAARRRDVRVRLDVQPTPPIQVDPLVLEQALTNLVRNAIEAAPAASDVEILWRARADGHVGIAVRDRGRGFGEDTARLFRVGVVQGAQSHGLGLPLAKRFVTAQGGRIELCSLPDGGAEALVIFPTAEEVS